MTVNSNITCESLPLEGIILHFCYTQPNQSFKRRVTDILVFCFRINQVCNLNSEKRANILKCHLSIRLTKRFKKIVETTYPPLYGNSVCMPLCSWNAQLQCLYQVQHFCLRYSTSKCICTLIVQLGKLVSIFEATFNTYTFFSPGIRLHHRGSPHQWRRGRLWHCILWDASPREHGGEPHPPQHAEGHVPRALWIQVWDWRHHGKS